MTLRIKKEQGFTLLEMIIVLALAGLFLSLMLERGPVYSTLASFLQARERLLSTLRNARLDAMTKGVSITVRPDGACSTPGVIRENNCQAGFFAKRSSACGSPAYRFSAQWSRCCGVLGSACGRT
ncbi:type II secretion system GspH family protein [Acetobacter indonesiensis]|uniref:pilus assembly FimT family protein n=1 Tax=Acetobacter indonesiensis TaxID=104101 RepID=UPI001F1ED8CE|nr:type II secretion system protein [Acetobacter indonesiensis]MCG0996297.1 type II secretion system GspH family protein [Acetobacter indonesiensis]